MKHTKRTSWKKSFSTLCCVLVSLFTTLLIIPYAQAQTPDMHASKWFFGKELGLSFSVNGNNQVVGGSISKGVTPLKAEWGCSSISTPSGTLLFYTNGRTVWKADHTVMTGGTGLDGDSTAKRSNIIVPKPSPFPGVESTEYYIFYTTSNHHLKRAIVDVALGQVTSKNVDITPANEVSQVLTACLHKNNRDAWLVAMRKNGNQFYVYNINPFAVSFMQAYNTGQSVNANETHRLYAKFSPNGKYLGLTIQGNHASLSSNKLLVYNFEASTGVINVSAVRQTVIATGVNNASDACVPSALEFSPCSSCIYVEALSLGSGVTGGGTSSVTIRYQINNTNLEKKGLITYADEFYELLYGGDLQLGPDKNLYSTARFNHGTNGAFVSRKVFRTGAYEMYEEDGSWIWGDKSESEESYDGRDYYSLPNFVTSYLDGCASHTPACDDCIDNTTFANVSWSTTHTITPAYAHPVCGTGITVTYQTRVCNGIRDMRIIGIEIPCGNNAGCSVQELLEFYEDLILADVYPELSIEPNVRVRFFIIPCWQQLYCTSASSVLWWVCSQNTCCFHSYKIQANCFDQLERLDIQQIENGNSIMDDDEDSHNASSSCYINGLLPEYTPPCLTTSATLIIKSCQQYENCRRIRWTPYRP